MERSNRIQHRRTELFLGTMALLLLIGGCVVVLRPFLSSLIWAIVLSYSLYPLQRRFTRWFRGSRTLAACLVTLTITLILAGPVVLIGFTMAKDARALGIATREWVLSAPEKPPAWVENMPVIGSEITGYWVELAESRDRWLDDLERASNMNAPRAVIVPEEENTEPPPVPPVPEESLGEEEEQRTESPELVILLGRLLGWTRGALITLGLAVGHGLTQVVVSAFLAFFLLRDASVLSERLGVVINRLAGGRGPHLLKVAGDTVRGVVYGMLGTALVQALVAGLGFYIAGVPGAVLLGVLTFFFAVIPFGPPIVWIPAMLWLFGNSTPGWGIFMLLYGTFGISGVDNVLRPYLISQGSKMPFALIFCGVVGGALAFGLVGVFLGPTLLAVGFRLIEEWSASTKETLDLSEIETAESETNGSSTISAG